MNTDRCRDEHNANKRICLLHSIQNSPSFIHSWLIKQLNKHDARWVNGRQTIYTIIIPAHPHCSNKVK